MKQQEVFKKIGGIINELNDQYEYLKTVDGQLNELELELFLANSHFLTDHLLILTKLNAQNALTTPPVEKTEALYTQNFFEPVVNKPNPVVSEKEEEKPLEDNKPKVENFVEDNPVPSIDLASESGSDNYEYVREEEPETIRHELILDEADWDEEDEPYAEEELKDELEKEEEIEIPPIPPSPAFTHQPEQPKPEEPQTVAVKPPEPAVKEYAKDEVLTINQRISAQIAAKNGVAEQSHVQSISDLKQAINLNDKLLFVKDLFNGYSLAYSEAIDILNRFNSFDEAEAFLNKNYTVKNNWESKPDTTLKLYALLKRRYA